MDAHDVDATINRICEESLPVELHIGRFIECMCSQMRGGSVAMETDTPEPPATPRRGDVDSLSLRRGEQVLGHSLSLESNAETAAVKGDRWVTATGWRLLLF